MLGKHCFDSEPLTGGLRGTAEVQLAQWNTRDLHRATACGQAEQGGELKNVVSMSGWTKADSRVHVNCLSLSQQGPNDRRDIACGFDARRCRATVVARAIPIQPDMSNAHFPRRSDIVEATACHMHPVRGVHSARFGETLKVAERRFVGSHLLCGDDEIESFVKRTVGLREKRVITIGQHRKTTVSRSQIGKHRFGIAKNRKCSPTGNERANRGVRERNSQIPGGAFQAQRQDVPVESVRLFRFDQAFVTMIRGLGVRGARTKHGIQ